jgi:hypothetical protein
MAARDNNEGGGSESSEGKAARETNSSRDEKQSERSGGQSKSRDGAKAAPKAAAKPAAAPAKTSAQLAAEQAAATAAQLAAQKQAEEKARIAAEQARIAAEENARRVKEAAAIAKAEAAAAEQKRQQDEIRARQAAYIQELSAQRAGLQTDPALMALQNQMNGPSVAAQALQLQQQQIAKQAMGQAQARGGFNPGNQRAAIMAGSEAAMSAAGQGAVAQAAEKQAATNMWANAYQQRQQGLDALYGQAQQGYAGQQSANANSGYDAQAFQSQLAQNQAALANQNAGVGNQMLNQNDQAAIAAANAAKEAEQNRQMQWNLGRLNYKQGVENRQQGLFGSILGGVAKGTGTFLGGV